MDKNSVKNLWTKSKGTIAVVSTGVAVVAIAAVAIKTEQGYIYSRNVCKFLYEKNLLEEFFKDDPWMVDVVNQTYHRL